MPANERSRANVFAALSLDRHSECRDDPDWLRERLGGDAACFVVLRNDGRALVNSDVLGLRALTISERVRLTGNATASFLGNASGSDHFALYLDGADADRLETELGGIWLDLRSAGLRLPAFDAGLFAYARALGYWQGRTRFCSVCGGRNDFVAAGHRARCTACGTEHFPRTDPAVIVIVSYRNACLLGRQAAWPDGRWSTLAGFVEPGETLEDAVRREVHEEAGVVVAECDYHSSQPWPFPSSLMLGFTAEAKDPTLRIGLELSDARWFEADALVRGVSDGSLVLSSPLSVSYRLIEHWLRQTAGLELAALGPTDAR